MIPFNSKFLGFLLFLSTSTISVFNNLGVFFGITAIIYVGISKSIESLAILIRCLPAFVLIGGLSLIQVHDGLPVSWLSICSWAFTLYLACAFCQQSRGSLLDTILYWVFITSLLGVIFHLGIVSAFYLGLDPVQSLFGVFGHGLYLFPENHLDRRIIMGLHTVIIDSWWRNCGIFHEPGLFGAVCLTGLMLRVFRDKFLIRFDRQTFVIFSGFVNNEYGCLFNTVFAVSSGCF